MNNLEKLLEQYESGDTLPLYLAFCSICDECRAKKLCKDDRMTCEESRARWLLQEYEEPDSWEKIEADMFELSADYWRCITVDSCSECPALIDGKNPKERFNATSCTEAKMRDIIRRCKALVGVE